MSAIITPVAPPPLRYADAALPLYDMGWAPIPLAPGTKTPIARWKGWNTDRPTRRQVAKLVRDFPDSAVGVAVPPTAFIIDSDLLDQQLQDQVVAAARATLGRPCMIRVGRWPKLMMFYGCAAGALRSRKMHPIELFAGSGQVVVAGIHHVTGRPYQWIAATPWQLGPAALTPVVTQPMVDAFLAAIMPALTGFKQRLARTYGPSPAHSFGVDVLAAFREEFVGRVRWYQKDGGEDAKGAQRAAVQQMLRQAVPAEAGAGDRHYRLMVLTEALVFRGWSPLEAAKACSAVFAEMPDLYPDYDPRTPGHWEAKAEALAQGAARRLATLRMQGKRA